MITLVVFGGLLVFLVWLMYEERKWDKEFQRHIEEAESELADRIKQHEDGG